MQKVSDSVGATWQRASLQQGSAGPQTASSELGDLEAKLALRPDWTEGWWQLATRAYGADRYDVAVPALERVVAGAPRMGLAYDLLGLSEFELKRDKAARDHLERARELANSDDPEVERVADYHLALLRIHDSDFVGAADLLQSAFGSAPSPQVVYARGLAALQVPLLPDEVDPSAEGLITAVGDVVGRKQVDSARWTALFSERARTPNLHLAYGQALEKAGQYRQALTAYQDEAKQQPRSPFPWLAIEQLERTEGHPVEAQRAHAQALALQSNISVTQQAIVARYSLRSETNSESGSWSEAMQSYASGDYVRAKGQLTSWVSRHPAEGTPWAVLGLCEFQLHQYDDALLHLQRGESLGLRGDPSSLATAHYTAGALLLRAGAFEQASEILTNAHKAAPGDPRAIAALGLALLRRTGLPLESDRGDPLLLSAGQVALLLQGSRYDEALPALRALLQRYPETPFLHYAYGTALIALSQFDEAAAEMRAELRISAKSPLPYLRLASIALRQHTPEQALRPAQNALGLAPQSAEAHYLFGRALLDTGKDEEAVRELEQARALNPASPEIHFNLARAYKRANRPEAADQERLTFARLNELSQAEKNGDAGQQTYTGPRQTDSLTSTPTESKPR